MAWGTIIAVYLFLAGVSAGSYITGVLIDWICEEKERLQTLRRNAILLSIPLLGIGLLLLMIDAEAGLFDPIRFIYLFANFPDSMMSNGTIILSLFMMISLVHGWKEWKGQIVPSWIKVIGFNLALATAAYTGLLIGVTLVPIWNNSLLPILFTVSALSTGIAFSVLVTVFKDRSLPLFTLPLKKLHLTLLSVELFMVFAFLYISAGRDEVALKSVDMIVSGELKILFWVGLIAIGLLLPIVIETAELIQKGSRTKIRGKVDLQHFSRKDHLWSTVLVESSTLIGGFALRLLILYAAFPVNLLP